MSNAVQFFLSESKQRFIDRFVLYMLRHGNRAVAPGRPVEEYARVVAAIYWEESLSDHLTPEEHAGNDLSFWAEDFRVLSKPEAGEQTR